MQVLIRQARVTDPQSDFHNQVVDLLIEDGVIKDIAASIPGDFEHVVSADGLMVSQGWVDIFADYREPGYEQKETLSTGLDAAAAGGFTNVLIAPNTLPAVSNKAAVRFIISRAETHPVSANPLGSVSHNIEGKTIAEMLDMHAHGAVAFTDGWKPVQNPGLLLKALEYVKAFDGTIIQIPIDATLSAGGLMNEGPVSTQLGMAGIPDIAETLIIHRDIELVRYTNSRLHITGISSATSVDMIRKAKAEGLQVTCSVTPYHLALNDEALRTYSSLYKVMPPIRSEKDRLALIEGLKDGTIDCVASHHRPQEWDAKAKEFEYCGDGMNVQQIAFNIAWTAIREAGVPLERLIDAMTTAPRHIFSLRRAVIQKGGRAELTFFNPVTETNVNDSNWKSLSKNHPFEEKALVGAIVGIFNNNRLQLN